ncbi:MULTISPECIES: hypothetical protein [Streptomyces]|uniref:hypothetical protein n=1 Tax=Streptomyces TaxID=1883 RepID=UPI00345C3A8F
MTDLLRVLAQAPSGAERSRCLTALAMGLEDQEEADDLHARHNRASRLHGAVLFARHALGRPSHPVGDEGDGEVPLRRTLAGLLDALRPFDAYAADPLPDWHDMLGDDPECPF